MLNIFSFIFVLQFNRLDSQTAHKSNEALTLIEVTNALPFENNSFTEEFELNKSLICAYVNIVHYFS
jgi:hypothetical protein